MADVDVTAPKQRVIGRPFAKGTSGNPTGRPKGARNKLTESFISDLHDCWREHGAEALQRVAKEDPGTLLKVMASLMPRDVRLDVSVVNVADFSERWHHAVEMLGNEVSSLPNRPMKVINGRNR